MPPKGDRKHPQQEFLQVETTNILFICGGTFTSPEDFIENCIGQKLIGFGAAIKTKLQRQTGGNTPEGQASAEFAIKRSGAMGLRGHDGALTGPDARWQAARELPRVGATRR